LTLAPCPCRCCTTEGLIEVRHGHGTYFAPPRYAYGLGPSAASADDLDGPGGDAGRPRSSARAFVEAPAPSLGEADLRAPRRTLVPPRLPRSPSRPVVACSRPYPAAHVFDKIMSGSSCRRDRSTPCSSDEGPPPSATNPPRDDPAGAARGDDGAPCCAGRAGPPCRCRSHRLSFPVGPLGPGKPLIRRPRGFARAGATASPSTRPR